jgi:hypothetical protein
VRASNCNDNSLCRRTHDSHLHPHHSVDGRRAGGHRVTRRRSDEHRIRRPEGERRDRHAHRQGRQARTDALERLPVADTPDPHWQVIDSKGTVYLLQRLPVKSLGGLAKDRITTSITVPAHIKDVVKVQIYCAWAEAVLGEASFGSRVTTE